MSIVKKWFKKGFTMAETLVAVAVLVILMAIISIPITNLIENIRQSKLDNMAKTVYVHAQNNLTKLVAAGRIDEIKYDGTVGGMYKQTVQPVDFDIETLSGESYDSNQLSVVTIEYPKINYFVAENAIDKNGKYVIEYNENSGDVYAVFYYENGNYTDFYSTTTDNTNSLRISIDARKEKHVGYYGGHIRDDITLQTDKIVSDIIINSKEVLTTDFVINMPVGKGREDDRIQFTITIKGLSSGKTRKITHETGKALTGGLTLLSESETDIIRRYSLTLDKLDSELSFYNQFVRTDGFISGENLSIEIVVSDLDNLDVASTQLEPRVFNSLFASLYEEDNVNYADIEYVRHLQNLNNFDSANVKDSNNLPITQLVANQTKDLNLNNDREGEYKDVYGSREFVPINKDFVFVYEGNNYYISNLTTNVTGNSGMFAEFYGKKLADIIMINTKAKGSNVGALVGEVKTLTSTANAPVEISNCYVYLDSELYAGKDASDNLYINGTNYAGGLVGAVTDVGVNINNSFAATTINGKTYAGGLVGYTASNVNVNSSYADCYIKADSTGVVGGLAGNVGTSSTFNSCYASGYLLSTCKTVAGFVPASVSSVTNSYNVFSTFGINVADSYALVADTTSMSRCYYYDSNKVMKNPGNKATRVRIDNSSTEDKDLYDLRALANLLGDNFVNNSSSIKSTPYRMSFLAAALERYPYPTLAGIKGTNTEAPHYNMISNHYGDWYEVVDINGQLAYFEVYSDGTAGFFTPGVSTLSEDKLIVYDGYCQIFKGTDTTEASYNSKITFYGNGEDSDPTFNSTIGTEYKRFDARDGKQYLYKIIPSSIIQAEPDEGKFYQKLVINNNEEFTYYFNPGYAKTVATVMGDVPGLVSIRTARHLNHMSKYYDSNLENIVETIFQQEQDINYGVYSWSDVGYSTISNHTPIGDSSNKFISKYNGNYHKIRNLNISSDTLAGLFGRTGADAIVYNVILSNTYKVDDTSKAGKITTNLTSGTGYVGSLVAYNEGEIQNCASDNFVINVNGSNSSTVYVGGLAGLNSGYITRSSADTPEINVTTNGANAYIGGFVGRNSSSIKYSYALGAINANKQLSGDVSAAGFATSNNAVSYAYCATAIQTNSSSINVYGFAGKGGSSVEPMYIKYLYDQQKIYEYAGTQYKYVFDTTKSSGSIASFNDLVSANINGFSIVNASSSYDHPTKLSTESYPFKSSVVDANGNPVHYGEWPDEITAGDIGFYYWELENGEYHYHILSSKLNKASREYSNLCTDYDCHNDITQFGYGYYIRKEYAKDTGITWGNVLNTGYMNVDHVTEVSGVIAEAINAVKDDYYFYSFISDVNGLCPSAAEVSTLDINVNRVQYNYKFAPLFGDSFTTNELNEYQVRSFAQLQNINWNGTAKNATTVDNGSYTSTYFYLGVPGSVTSPNFKQSHNVAGNGRNFTPIACSTAVLDYNRLGFMGKYDGQTYEINNININTDHSCDSASAIGLFGYVTNAELTEIVLYSPNGSGQICKTGANLVKNTGKTGSYYRGSYCIGGIVGYMNGNSTISNSCVAGYTILDTVNDKNKGATHVYIGGVVGCAKSQLDNDGKEEKRGKITNCSSYVKILPQTYTTDSSGNFAYVHVGSIAGAASYVSNCFSGGIIQASTGGTGNDARFHLSGIVSGMDITHYTAMLVEDSMQVENCYSFTELNYDGKNANVLGSRYPVSSLGKTATPIVEANNASITYKSTYNLNRTYPFTPTDNSDTKARTSDQMVANSFLTEMGSGFGKADITNAVSSALKGKDFPLPTSIKRGDKFIYYGDWDSSWAPTESTLKASTVSLYLNLYTSTNGNRDSVTSCDISYYDNIGTKTSMTEAPTYTFASSGTTESNFVDVEFTSNNDNPRTYKMTVKAKDQKGNESITLKYNNKTLTLPISVEGSLYLSITTDKSEVFEKEITAGDKANVVNYVIELGEERDSQLFSNLRPEDWTITDVDGNPISNYDIEFIDENGNVVEHPITQITSGENKGKYSLYIRCLEDLSTDDERLIQFVVSANVTVNDTYHLVEPEVAVVTDLTILPVSTNLKIQYYPYIGATTPIEGATQTPTFNSNVTSSYAMTNEQLAGRKFVKWVDADFNEFNPSTTKPITVRKSYKLYATYEYYTISIYDVVAGESILNSILYKSVNSDQYYVGTELSDESKTTTISIPAKDKYEFLKVVSQDGSTVFANKEGVIQSSIEITGDTDFYIDWFTNVHVINFYDKDDTDIAISGKYKEFETGTNYLSEETELPTVSVDSHYLFDGWKIKGESNDKVLFDKDGNLLELTGYYESGKWTASNNILLSPRLKQKDALITLKAGDHAADKSKTISGIWGVAGTSSINIGNNTVHDPESGYELEGYGYVEGGKNIVVIGIDQSFKKSTKYTDANGLFTYTDTSKPLELVGLYKPCEATLVFNADFNGYSSTNAKITNGYTASQIVTDNGALTSLTFGSGRSSWTLDGWYYINGDKYYKVIDSATNKFVEGSGLISGDKFVGVDKSGDTIELRAVWKKQLTAMYEYSKELNDNELLSEKSDGKYLLIGTIDSSVKSTKSIYVTKSKIGLITTYSLENVTLSSSGSNNLINTDGTLVTDGTNILKKPSANRIYIVGNYDNYLWTFTGYKSKDATAKLQHVDTGRQLQFNLGGVWVEATGTDFKYFKDDPSIQKDKGNYLDILNGKSSSSSKKQTYLFKKITVGTVNHTAAGEHTVTAEDMIIYDVD